MKARPFLITLATSVIVLLLVAFGLNWSISRQSPLNIKIEALELPRAARFIPKTAGLTLHWQLDPNSVDKYAEAVAPTYQRTNALKNVAQLRDGIFALAGLDFNAELSEWIAPQISLSLIGSPNIEEPTGWVIALTSKETDGAKRFLQRFWQTRSLTGTELQISSYRGMGVITGKSALLGRKPQPLATALIDDDLLLLASGRGVLEQALDVSQLPEKHQQGDNELQRDINQLRNGVAILTASPAAMNRWLGVPLSLSQRDDIKDFVGSINLEGRDLVLDGIFRFKEPLEELYNVSNENLPLLDSIGGEAQGLALLNNPSKILKENINDPLSQLISSTLKNYLNNNKILTMKRIIELDDGPLIWLDEPGGWVVLTEDNHPALDNVNEILSEQNLSKSDLDSEIGKLQVWSKLITKRQENNSTLDTELAVVLSQEDNQNWWGETLAAIQQSKQSKLLPKLLRKDIELNSSEDNKFSQQLFLSSTSSQEQLNKWQPWELIQTIAGKSLNKAIKGLSIAIGIDQNIDHSLIHLIARINMG